MSEQIQNDPQQTPSEPQNAADYNQRAWIHLAKNELEEAEIDFKKSLDMNSRNADASYGLGMATLKLGYKDQALKIFRQTLELINTYLVKEKPQRSTVMRNQTLSQIRMLENNKEQQRQ